MGSRSSAGLDHYSSTERVLRAMTGLAETATMVTRQVHRDLTILWAIYTDGTVKNQEALIHR